MRATALLNIAIFLFVVIIFSVSASLEEYPYIGTNDSDFICGIGEWDQYKAETDIDKRTRNLNSGKWTPLVDDLDGDGTNEIVVFDAQTVRLYQTNDLTQVDSYTIVEGDVDMSPPEVFDWDGDGYKEVIFILEDNEYLYALEYDGNSFTNETRRDIQYLGCAGGHFIHKCGAVDECFMAFSEYDSHASAFGIRILGFNSTNVTHKTVQIESTGGSSRTFCFPTVPAVQYNDYDGDGTSEYVFSAVRVDPAGDEVVYFWTAEVFSNMTAGLELEVSETEPDDVSSASSCAVSNNFSGRMVTNPLVNDFDPGGSKEIALGFMDDENEFKIHVYDENGNELDDFPEVAEADGILISNLILSNAFEDTDTNDFCVVGYRPRSATGVTDIDLLCGSMETGEIPQTREYLIDVQTGDPLHLDFMETWTVAHAVNVSGTTTDGNNMDEFLTPFGIFYLDDPGVFCDLTGYCSMTRLYLPRDSGGSMIQLASWLSVDVEKSGYDDLIGMTQTKLYYLDDKYVNQGAYISGSNTEYNPCITDYTVKLNESFEVRIRVIDPDGDDVQAMAVLYFGDDNAQNTSWSGNYSSNTSILRGNMIFNKTTSTGVLRIYGRDTVNPTTLDYEDVDFTVGTDGVEFGEILCYGEATAEELAEEEGFTPTTTDYQDNAVTSSLTVISDLSGGMSEQVIWYIIMIVIAIGIVGVKSHHSMDIKLGIIVIVEVIMLIVGRMLDIVPVGVIITLGVACLIPVGLWVRKHLAGHPTR